MTSSAAIQRLPLLDFSYVPMADAARRSGLELALGINRGTETFFLLRAERVHDVVVAKLVGRKRPIHVSATGKAILAFEPPEVIEAVLRSGVVERTNSGLGLDELREDLEFTRQTGHARNFGEGRPPGRGIAVPIFDGQHRVVAGLGAPLPLSGGSEEQVVAVLQEARYEIARSLGYVKELELSLP
jgi:DNA-binding IclR family transcriptional regulator